MVYKYLTYFAMINEERCICRYLQSPSLQISINRSSLLDEKINSSLCNRELCQRLFQFLLKLNILVHVIVLSCLVQNQMVFCECDRIVFLCKTYCKSAFSDVYIFPELWWLCFVFFYLFILKSYTLSINTSRNK